MICRKRKACNSASWWQVSSPNVVCQFVCGSQNIIRKVHPNITFYFALLVGCKIVNISMAIEHRTYFFLTVSSHLFKEKMESAGCAGRIKYKRTYNSYLECNVNVFGVCDVPCTYKTTCIA